MKITVLGGGNAGCFTALYFAWESRNRSDVIVELRHNPSVPPEPVGQASLLSAPHMLWSALGFNWYNNPIYATMKSGILYENWGKKSKHIFSTFPAHNMGMHYSTVHLQDYILKSGWFDVIEDSVLNPDDIDSDYVIDCRGKPSDMSLYDTLTNPLNSAILGRPKWDCCQLSYSRHVATPDGWTFVIPTPQESPSIDFCVGYLFNDTITDANVATSNFKKLFDVDIIRQLKFKNYVAKNITTDNRVFLNGNKFFFIEPMESTSVETYIQIAKKTYYCIVEKQMPSFFLNGMLRKYVYELQNFILWHYKTGSVYDTPFWTFAQELASGVQDKYFDNMLNLALSHSDYDVLNQSLGGTLPDEWYAQWAPWNFKLWYNHTHA